MIKKSFIIIIISLFYCSVFEKSTPYRDDTRMRVVVQTGGQLDYMNFTPDGKYLLTWSQNGMKVWEVISGREIYTSNYGGRLTHDGKYIIGLTKDRDSIIFNNFYTGNIEKKYCLNYKNPRSKIFLASEKYIAILDYPKMKLIDLSDGDEIWDSDEFSVNINQLTISPDNKYILTGGDERDVLKLWDAESGEFIRKYNFTTSHWEPIEFSSDGKKFIVNNRRIYDTQTGDEIDLFQGGIAYHRMNGIYYAIKKETDKIQLWEVFSNKLIKEFPHKYKNVNSFALSYNKKIMVVVGNQLTWYDIPNGEIFNISNWQKTYLSTMSNNNDNIIFGKDNCIYRININQPKITELFNLGKEKIKLIKISSNSQFAAAVGYNGNLWLLNILTKKTILFSKRSKGEYRSLEFSKDSKYLTAIDQLGKIFIWKLPTGKLIRSYTIPRLESYKSAAVDIAISPDNKFIVIPNWEKIIMCDFISGKLIRIFNLKNNQFTCVAFSEDGNTVAAGGAYILMDKSYRPNGQVYLWNTVSGVLVNTFKGHNYIVRDIRFSNNNNFIISGAADNNAMINDLSKGTSKILNGHYGWLHSVGFFSDDKYATTASEDGTLRIWDTITGKEKIKIISVGSEDWVITNPTGFFEATENATNFVHFSKGLSVFELDQFFEHFYKPNLLAYLLNGKNIDKTTINIEEKIKTSPPPVVEIIKPKMGIKTKEKEIEVQIKVTDTGGGINEIKLLHNGKRVNNDTRGFKKQETKNENSLIKFYKVILISGENHLTCSAFSNERIESKSDKIKVFYQGTLETSTSYILAIGINNYKNSKFNLNYAKADAEGFLKLIKQKSRNLFSNLEITTLLDNQATKMNILNALEDISKKSKPIDVFTFFYAGHGSVVDNRFYLVTTENVRLYERQKLDSDAIYIGDFQNILKNIPALKQVIIIDACQSGAAMESFAQRGAVEEKAMAQLSRSSGVHVLASSGSEQFASEYSQLGHGIFTYSLIMGLNGKADGSPKDGKVTIYELKSFLDDQVPLLAEKYIGQSQWPNTFSRGQDFPLILTE